MLLKTSKLVSKFENPRPVAETPFSQQRERFLDNLGRSSICSSLLAVECTAMIVKALGITIAKQRNKHIQKRFGRRKVNTRASVECELSVDHIAGHPVETSGRGLSTFGFHSAPATSLRKYRIGRQAVVMVMYRKGSRRMCHGVCRENGKRAEGMMTTIVKTMKAVFFWSYVYNF